jgi:hypothetical protein
MEESRRPWRRPNLVTITRSDPQERVLEVCKTAGIMAGWENVDNGCFSTGGFDCYTPIAS